MPTELEEQPVTEQTEAVETTEAVEQVDPQAELLETDATEEALVEQPQMDPKVLELMQRQQETIELLNRQISQGQQPETPKAAALTERLKARGMDDSTIKLFEAFAEEFGTDLKPRFLEREYGHLLLNVAKTTDERAAIESLKTSLKATDAEIGSLNPHIDAVRKEYGNLPTKALQELALTRLRSGKPVATANGLSAARQAKQDALKKTPTLKNSPGKLVADSISQEAFDKLSPVQQIAVLNGKNPADYADL